MSEVVRAPRGTELTCKGWLQEAALRMLMNNLDPEVAERPRGSRRLRRHRQGGAQLGGFDAIVRELRTLENDETLLVQSGKPVGVFRTHAGRAARADRQLEPGRPLGDLGRVPRLEAARADDVRPDDGRLVDLHRLAGHRAGHVRDVRGRAARRTSAAPLRGRLVRLGAGSAAWAARSRSPPPWTAASASASRSIPRASSAGSRRGYLDELRDDLDSALRRVDECERDEAARSIALVGNAADVYAELVRARRDAGPRHRPDLGARSAQRLRPAAGLTLDEAAALRERDPEAYVQRSRASMAGARRGDARDAARAARTFRLRQQPARARRERGGRRATRSTIPGFVPAYIRPLFCEGKGPFRWVALSGDPDDIARAPTRPCSTTFPDDATAASLDRRWRASGSQFQGLPARICWLGYGERAQGRARASTSWCAPARSRRPSSSAAITSTAARSPRPTARPRR